MNFGVQFLKHPKLFPAGPSCDPWGDQELVIDFVGGPYLFSGLNSSQASAIQDRFGALCSPPPFNDIDPVVHAVVFTAPEEEFKRIDTRGWVNHIDFEYSSSSLRFSGKDFMAGLSLQPRLEATLWTFQDHEIVSDSIFENFFRVIVAYRIMELGGMLLHSAGLADEKGAWLFIGRSNAGKTTLSRLGQEAGLTVLSDDMNAVFMKNGEFITERLPFAGELGQAPVRSRCYPIRAIYQLKKSLVNTTVSPLRTEDQLAMLMVCSPFVNADSYQFVKLVINIHKLTNKVPGYRLDFTRSSELQYILV